MKKYIVTILLATVVMGSSQTVWTVLEQMNLEERQNSKINLVLESNATDEAWTKAHYIENLWNNGRYDDALALFLELKELTDVSKMAIS